MPTCPHCNGNVQMLEYEWEQLRRGSGKASIIALKLDMWNNEKEECYEILNGFCCPYCKNVIADSENEAYEFLCNEEMIV